MINVSHDNNIPLFTPSRYVNFQSFLNYYYLPADAFKIKIKEGDEEAGIPDSQYIAFTLDHIPSLRTQNSASNDRLFLMILSDLFSLSDYQSFKIAFEIKGLLVSPDLLLRSSLFNDLQVRARIKSFVSDGCVYFPSLPSIALNTDTALAQRVDALGQTHFVEGNKRSLAQSRRDELEDEMTESEMEMEPAYKKRPATLSLADFLAQTTQETQEDDGESEPSDDCGMDIVL